jgi:hypothetical protein
MVHTEFLSALRRGDEDKFKFNDWLLHGYEKISMNSLCWLGSDFARFEGRVESDEKSWLTQIQPKVLGRPNVIHGQAQYLEQEFDSASAIEGSPRCGPRIVNGN